MKTHSFKLLLGVSALAFIGSGAFAQDVPALNPALEPVEGSAEVTGKEVDKDAFVLGLSNISVVNTWRVQMIEEAVHEAEIQPAVSEMIVTDAGGDVSKQVSDIEDLVSRGIDALLVAPGSEVALNGVLQSVYDAGIPVIIFSSDATPDDYTVKILGDDVDFGRAGAQFLADTLDGKGNVIAVRGISGNSIENDRWSGVEEVFANYPDIKVIDEGFADWAYDKGKQVCESLLVAHSDVDAIWSSGGAMTQACAEVIEDYGLPMIPMNGEGNNGFLRIWQEMDLDTVAPQYPTWFGQQAVIAAVRLLEGETVYQDYALRPEPITKDTIAEYYRPELNDSYWVGSSLPEETLVEIYGK